MLAPHIFIIDLAMLNRSLITFGIAEFSFQNVSKKLLAMNEDLNQACILKDAIKRLWAYKFKPGKFLEKWIGLAKETGISELERFAKGLNRARDGLLSYCQHQITSAKIEAF